MDYEGAWKDLQQRVNDAEKTLFNMLDRNDNVNYDRLRGKLSGVRLIQNYMREYED